MRRFVHILWCCALVVVVAGCVRSVRPVFPDSTGVSLLPANAILISDSNDVYKMSARRSAYDFDPDYAGSYRTALFVDLDGKGGYIAQALTHDEGYYYTLAIKEGDNLNLYSFEAGTFADRNRLAITKRLNDSTVQIENRTDMVSFYRAALNHLDKANKSTYKILDYDDPNQRAVADDFIVRYKQKKAREASDSAKSSTAAPKSRTPSSSGAWSLAHATDPMTDAKIVRITGKPASYEGTTAIPSMQVSCGPNGLRFAIYWGATMADLYPSGEADYVGVDVRFDKSEAVRLAWAPSSDWATTFNPNPLAAGVGQMAQSLMEAILPAQKVTVAWDETAFHQSMKRASQLVVRAGTRSGNWAIVQFDTSGYSELARAFPPHCG